MDLMSRRRSLIGTSIEPEVNPFITITNAFSNAFDAKTEIDALMAHKGITENNKIIVGKLISNSNNRLIAKDWINLNGVSGYFVRERGGVLAAAIPWGSASYDCAASVGDEYYVIDPLNIQRGGTFRIRASQNYTNAWTVLSFIRDNMPDNSLYAVIRKFDPSELVLYDCIAIFLDSSQQVGLRADSTKKASNIPAWTTGYDCKIYSGDELYYIKIETRT